MQVTQRAEAEAASRPPTAQKQAAKTGTLRRLLMRPEMGAVAGAVGVWLFFALTAGGRGFLTLRGTANYLEVAAQFGILAIAVALLMIGGEFDLSIGSMIGACGIIFALLSANFGWNVWMAMLASLAFAILLGIFNGALVLTTGLPSFIVTLGTLLMIRGVTVGTTRLVTGRTVVSGLGDLPGYDAIRDVFASKLTIGNAGFSIAILWWLVIAALATWVLLRTPFGNWIYGVGGNPQAARNVGVPINLVKIVLFIGTAVAAWLVAMIQVLGARSADVVRGTGTEFTAIIAAVIGGVLLTGGYGSAVGAVFGALIFGMVRQGIVFLGIDPGWEDAVLGAMLVIAVLVNRYVRHRALGVRE
ncbi:MAG: ABC transporter permease [Thermomicrobiales bacterium]|nr:ABC transporter permease [Thermomicrobiales bacterium]